MAVGSKNGDTTRVCSIISHLAPVWQDFVGGSKPPGADKQFRLGKDRHRHERKEHIIIGFAQTGRGKQKKSRFLSLFL
jgi:hypothetical protein